MSDPRWLAWMSELVDAAARTLRVTACGPSRSGLDGRSLGCPVTTATGRHWLRVVTDRPPWTYSPAWTGNSEASVIRGVTKPIVTEHTQWDQDGRRVRAELMTLAPGDVMTDEMVLRRPVDLDRRWWADLHQSLDALAAHTTERTCLDDRLLRHRLSETFGLDLDLGFLQWSTAHGDLHWANLTAPECWLLDWESWGRAPAGYDAALLAAVSLLQPEVARRVRVVFSDLLDTPTGQIAQLAAAAKLLELAGHGHHPDLAEPLRRHAEAVLGSLRVPG